MAGKKILMLAGLILLILSSSLIMYFYPYILDKRMIVLNLSEEKLLIEQKEFSVSFTIDDNCSLNSTPSSYIKRRYWIAKLECNETTAAVMSVSSSYKPNQNMVKEEIEKIQLLPKMNNMDRTYIKEVLGHRTAIYVLNEKQDRYFVISMFNDIEPQIKNSIEEI